MKVNFSKDAKKFVTVAELPFVKEIQEQMRSYDSEGDIELAVSTYFGPGFGMVYEVYEYKMEISKNYFCRDEWGEGSGMLDVICTAKALTSKGFVIMRFSFAALHRIKFNDEESRKFFKNNTNMRLFREEER